MKRLLLAALLAGSILPGVGASYADHCPEPPDLPDPECELEHQDYGCGFDSVQQETATGQNFEGVAYGFVVGPAGSEVSIRCYITVNDVPAAAGSTPTGTGTTAATTAGPISFEAADGASVKLCTEVDGTTVECNESTTTEFPPQEVIDAIDDVFLLLEDILQDISDASAALDPLLCPVLRDLAPGVPGVVDIALDGDVSVVELGKVWNCPPYES